MNRNTPWILAAALVGIGGCSHPKHEAVLHYDAELAGRLGRAKQADILTLMGEPQIRDRIGEAEVWVYQYKGTDDKDRARPEVRMVAPEHDELILSFDREGVLQKYNLVVEGRRRH